MTDLRPAAAPGVLDAPLQRRRRAIAASVAVAAATTVVTGCAHALGGGAAPDALLLLAAAIATMLVLAPVLGAEGAAWRRLLAVVLAQLLQHGLYSLPGLAAPHAGGHHGAPVALEPATLQAAALVHDHAAMPLAHVGAGLVTLWLLAAVPRAVAAVLRATSTRLAALVLGLVAAPPTTLPRGALVAARPARRDALVGLRRVLVRRGPPLPVG